MIIFFQCGCLVPSMVAKWKDCSMVYRIPCINDHMGKLCVLLSSNILLFAFLLSMSLYEKEFPYKKLEVSVRSRRL